MANHVENPEVPQGWTAQGTLPKDLVECPLCGREFRHEVLMRHAQLTHGYVPK